MTDNKQTRPNEWEYEKDTQARKKEEEIHFITFVQLHVFDAIRLSVEINMRYNDKRVDSSR